MTLCNHYDAVRWNPFNQVVQCHVCGHVWVPLEDPNYRERVEAEQKRLHGVKPTSVCTGCRDDCLHCSMEQVQVKQPTLDPPEVLKEASTLLAAEVLRRAIAPLPERESPCDTCQWPYCEACEHKQ